ncbi:hypothetical protein PISS_a2200 [Pseudoalteromonas issachenkonii]|uniref:Uncharacterized protein n=1 Tax=Pseudoalteromonas issachenkonii TaxID=152297 RepID=A0ABN5C8L8_9GAMM|nr:hypothetical protein PSM_A1959 [Pseudoalteromonas sp. SM9913]ATC91040.1 hypothetical protein PISS_a2200 [Pseudoalteromonas issachenkonii]
MSLKCHRAYIVNLLASIKNGPSGPFFILTTVLWSVIFNP